MTREQMDPAVKDALALYDNIIRLPVRPINPHERKEHRATIHYLHSKRTDNTDSKRA